MLPKHELFFHQRFPYLEPYWVDRVGFSCHYGLKPPLPLQIPALCQVIALSALAWALAQVGIPYLVISVWRAMLYSGSDLGMLLYSGSGNQLVFVSPGSFPF